jgi:hypothetical protein
VEPSSRRGELRIYFGAAPGVGKTYAALGEAHRRAAEAHCFPDRAIIVAVGDPAKVRSTLETFGPVKDLTPPV